MISRIKPVFRRIAAALTGGALVLGVAVDERARAGIVPPSPSVPTPEFVSYRGPAPGGGPGVLVRVTSRGKMTIQRNRRSRTVCLTARSRRTLRSAVAALANDNRIHFVRSRDERAHDLAFRYRARTGRFLASNIREVAGEAVPPASSAQWRVVTSLQQLVSRYQPLP